MELSTKLRFVSGIGPLLSEKLERLNLFTVEDLIYHFPFRYDDFSKISPVSEISVGEVATFQGQILSINNTYTKSRKVLTKALLNDGTNTIEMIWFNSSWLTKTIRPGDKLQVSGKVQKFHSKVSLVAPKWEKIFLDEQKTLHTGRLVPVYPETYGLTSKWIRNKIDQVLPQILTKVDDPLPKDIKNSMLDLKAALQQIHFPKGYQEVLQAKKRLAFDELFYIQLSTQQKRLEWANTQTTKPLKIDQEKLTDFIDNLPFKLTQAQQRVIQEIIFDLQKSKPANRLVQGEVGSGKTVVAAVILYLTYLNGLRSILMAPTEILAFQHFSTLTKLLEPYNIKIGIYTGSRKRLQVTVNSEQKKQDKSSACKLVPVTSDVIVGTHALLSEKLQLDNIGLVVIDEQQRFGVKQRGLLRTQAKSPHFLTMTATPIPRTVALTIYGDLDLSVIDEMPKGRKEVKTYFVPEKKRTDSYTFINKLVTNGQQVYIITPLIEESETALSAKAAKVEFERLQTEVFPHLKLGLLHGRLKSKEKEEVINKFKNHEIDILVSTSVVEVGVDVPNATVMVIEGAERFGLAQLHQLRGRVGRGEEQSYTFLFTEQENPQIVRRLKNLEQIHDGLKLAELDLQIRGSGEIFGSKQSGEWDLKIASLTNLELIEETKKAATKLLQDDLMLDKYPQIKRKLLSLQDIMPD